MHEFLIKKSMVDLSVQQMLLILSPKTPNALKWTWSRSRVDVLPFILHWLSYICEHEKMKRQNTTQTILSPSDLNRCTTVVFSKDSGLLFKYKYLIIQTLSVAFARQIDGSSNQLFWGKDILFLEKKNINLMWIVVRFKEYHKMLRTKDGFWGRMHYFISK